MARKYYFADEIDRRLNAYQQLMWVRPTEADPTDANLISSECDDGGHMPLIDIDDIPVRVVPSSTPGCSHLYIDKKMGWRQYEKLLEALTDAGVVEREYFQMCKDLRASFVRTPESAKPVSEDARSRGSGILH